MTSSLLHKLAERVGIEAGYWDVNGNHHETSDETRQHFLSAMGYATKTDDEIQTSLIQIQERSWQRDIEPVTVLRAVQDVPHSMGCIEISVVLPDDVTASNLEWNVALENCSAIHGHVSTATLNVIERRTLADKALKRVAVPLPADIPLGYHTIHIDFETHQSQGTLIIAPKSSYQPDWMTSETTKIWGVACQLYSLKSVANWGIGDFGDIADLYQHTAKSGGNAVGLPPLHTLFHSHPEWVSPYSPSSRLFLNPIYISVPNILEFETCPAAKDMVQDKDFAEQIDNTRATDAVDFEKVLNIKHRVLRVLFDDFKKRYATDLMNPRRRSFDNFVINGGGRLHNFSVFETLLEQLAPKLPSQWEDEYLDPTSPEILQFSVDHRASIEYYMYLQWLCDQQLSSACDHGEMKIGLYRDLAVGVSPDGADAWIDPKAFVSGVRFGAPPDPLGPLGQDWGMPPFNPEHLYETAYGPYVEMLRSNMRHAGALRIDHVMWLQRMFWIPPGGDGRDGAYVRYPLDDLLAILALESQRNTCLVIGEALGTVTDGFRERLADEGILSYCLLQFERYEDGLYKRPDVYPHMALTTPASHDLPTLAGFWGEQDIQVQLDVGILDSAGSANQRRQHRNHERACLISALADQGLISPQFPNSPHISELELNTLIIAVHNFLARTPSALMMVNLEDILKSCTQINVPGTVDEYPNWRLKLSQDLEQICTKTSFKELAEHLNAERATDACKV